VKTWHICLAALGLCAVVTAESARAGPGDSYRRQTVVNNSGQAANDLHIEFHYRVNDAKVRPKDQPPGHDGDGALSGRPWGRVVDFAPPNSFGTVNPGGVAYVDYEQVAGLGTSINAANSYFTYDGNALPGFEKRGLSMAINWTDYDTATVVVRNDLPTPQRCHSIQLWVDNDLANLTIDTYFAPTGPPVGGVPPEIILQPGEEVPFEFGTNAPYTYLLATVASEPESDPLPEPYQSYAAAPAGPAPARMIYDCLTGNLLLDAGENVLNGFILHSEEGEFTGAAILPGGFLFNWNDPHTIASEFVDPVAGAPLMGVHDFGNDAADRARLWDPIDGRWEVDDWDFTYTVEGQEGAFSGPIELLSHLPGDTDLDGDVDAWDIQLILAANSYEKAGVWEWEHGDFNRDTLVDWADIEMILDHGQYDSPAEEALLALPEPATLVLLAAGGLALLRRRRR